MRVKIINNFNLKKQIVRAKSYKHQIITNNHISSTIIQISEEFFIFTKNSHEDICFSKKILIQKFLVAFQIIKCVSLCEDQVTYYSPAFKQLIKELSK